MVQFSWKTQVLDSRVQADLLRTGWDAEFSFKILDAFSFFSLLWRMNPGIETFLFLCRLPVTRWSMMYVTKCAMQCWVWHDSGWEEQKCSWATLLKWDFDILKLFSAFEARLQSDVSDSPPLYLMVVLTCPCAPARAAIQVLLQQRDQSTNQTENSLSISGDGALGWTARESPLFCVIVTGMLLLRQVQGCWGKTCLCELSAVYIGIQLWVQAVPWPPQTLQMLPVHQDSACL